MPSLRLRRMSGVALSGVWLLAACGVDVDGLGASQPRAETTQPPEESDPLPPQDDSGVEEGSTRDGGALASTGGAKSCDLEGTFALRIDATMSWEGTTLFGIVPIILKGQGPFRIDTLVDIKKSPKGLVANLRACGAITPDFAASVGERYGVTIPDANWEKLAARWSAGVNTKCSAPGCKYTSELLTAQIGIDIPPQATWPTSRDPLDSTTFVDADGDGTPGFLFLARGEADGPMYKHPPTSYLLIERIREMSLAVRVAAQLDGLIDSCDRYSGEAKQLAIETRALGCRLDSGELCREDQLSFLDDNLPVWTVDTARWRTLRMPANASCADARAAFP